MQRTLLIVLATAVVAAVIATTATILLTDDDEPQTALASPSASPVFTVDPTDEPSASPDATDVPQATDDGGTAPTASPSSTEDPDVVIRSAKDVDCDEEPGFCSSADSAVVEDDKLAKAPTLSSDPTSSSRPTITMSSEVRKDNDSKASVGDAVRFVHIDVVVTNKTDDTFRFAKREVVLELYRNGKLLDEYSTTGPGFDMTPGSKMNASFDRPIQDDGTYRWRTKVWYYKK